MFRFLGTFALLAFTACQKAPAPHQIDMPAIPIDFAIVQDNDCPWAQADMAIFNQDAQRLKFRYRACDKTKKTFYISDGNKLYVALELVPTMSSKFEVLRIDKLGPETPKSYLTSRLPIDGIASGLCDIEQLNDKVWRLTSNFKPDMDAIFKSLEVKQVVRMPKDPCGEFAEYPGRLFAFEQGLVFSIGGEGVGQVIDLNSITYENKG